MAGDYLEGIQEATRNEQVSVNTSSSVVCESRNKINPRKAIIIRNTSDDSADKITLNIGYNEATSNNGIVLGKDESWGDNSETGYNCHQGAITAICATANGKLSIYER